MISTSDICCICQQEETKEAPLEAVECNNSNLKHSYHPDCIMSWVIRKQRQGKTPNCPLCHQTISKISGMDIQKMGKLYEHIRRREAGNLEEFLDATPLNPTELEQAVIFANKMGNPEALKCLLNANPGRISEEIRGQALILAAQTEAEEAFEMFLADGPISDSDLNAAYERSAREATRNALLKTGRISCEKRIQHALSHQWKFGMGVIAAVIAHAFFSWK